MTSQSSKTNIDLNQLKRDVKKNETIKNSILSSLDNAEKQREVLASVMLKMLDCLNAKLSHSRLEIKRKSLESIGRKFVKSDSKLKELRLEEVIAEHEKREKFLRKQLTQKDNLLKSNGLEQFCSRISHRDECKSQPHSLKTWKAFCGQKSKNVLKHTKVVSNPLPFVFKIERVGSLPGRICKTKKIEGSLHSKCDQARKSVKIEKEARNTTKSQKNKQSNTKVSSKKKNLIQRHSQIENQTPIKHDERPSYAIDNAQRSHSAPHRTSEKIGLGEAYYIGQGKIKNDDRMKDHGELDISFDSASSNEDSFNFNENDLTLQKRYHLPEQDSIRSCERRLTFTKLTNLKKEKLISCNDLYDEENNKENLDINSKNFNSPCFFDLTLNDSRAELFHLMNGEMRNSIKIVDQFQITNSKLVEEMPKLANSKREAEFMNSELYKQQLHRRNSTKFNLITDISQRQQDIFSRIERNIRSSYSSGKKITSVLGQIQGKLTQNQSADDLVLLGSLKKENPFLKPSPIVHKNKKLRYKELSKDNFTDEL